MNDARLKELERRSMWTKTFDWEIGQELNAELAALTKQPEPKEGV